MVGWQEEFYCCFVCLGLKTCSVYCFLNYDDLKEEQIRREQNEITMFYSSEYIFDLGSVIWLRIGDKQENMLVGLDQTLV